MQGLEVESGRLKVSTKCPRFFRADLASVGDKYPSAAVQGVDLSPIQPPFVPPNVKFMIDDIEDDWLYPEDHFDYIHCRHVTQTIKNRPRLMEQAFR